MGSRSEQRLVSPVDAAWLGMDRAQNPMVITGLLRVKGLDAPTLASFLGAYWLPHDRFRRRPVQRNGAWWWQEAPVDLSEHLECREYPLQDDNALRLQVSACQKEHLPSDRPLWKFWYFPMADGDHAVVLRLHHCYADGISLIRVFESLTTTEPDTMPEYRDPVDNGTPAWTATVSGWVQRQFQQLGSLEEASDAIDRLSVQGLRLVRELSDFLLQGADTPSSLKGALSGEKQCCWSQPVPLKQVQAAARDRGCTLNDVLLASVTQALQRQLIRAGDSLEERQMQAAVPVDIRRLLPEELRGAEGAPTNLFGTVFVPLPMDADSVLEGAFRIKHETKRLKSSWQPGLSWALLALAGYLPAQLQRPLVEAFAGRASAVVSNVPGSSVPRYLAGHEVREHLFWVPQAGDIGLGISIISYAGKVQFGVQADQAVLSDPQVLMDDCLVALASFIR